MAHDTQQTLDGATFPPPGWLDQEGVASMFGIVPKTLGLWYTNGKIRCGKWVKRPGGKLCKTYPINELLRIKHQMEASRPTVPDGYVDIDGACKMFGVCKAAWLIWKRQGKVPRGKPWRSRTNKPCRIYAVDELKRIFEDMRGADKVFKEAGGSSEYHIPEGWIRIQDACRMFGVHRNTWERWEREGLLTCGKRFLGQRLKLYPTEEVNRLLAECGRYEPPYLDPERPGVYRIPLSGQGMHRREAIIDAEDLPIAEGRTWYYSEQRPDLPGQVATFDPDGDTRLHHRIMGVNGNAWRVGHRNGDPLDCRRANLVVRTRSENNAGMHKAQTFCGRPCTSRFKGVCWDRRREKWVAYIKKDRVSRTLGRFHDEIASAQAYDEAARELFGEHARLNFPDGVDAALERMAA